MLLNIVLYGNKVLHGKAEEVGGVTPEIRRLAENMLETMYYHEGLGLAAPQVGVPLRLAVMDVRHEGSGKIILVDPVIIRLGETIAMEEGCLSLPGITAPVERAVEVTVEYGTLGGSRKTMRATGVTAQAVQHEIDHLDGILIPDRVGVARRALMAAGLRRLRARSRRGEHR
ncbi:MAG: peptide deformylase [bacterium]|nr:peptide deformylase [bacterium]